MIIGRSAVQGERILLPVKLVRAIEEKNEALRVRDIAQILGVSGKTQRVEGLRSCQLELKPSCCQIANSLIEIEVHLPLTPGTRLLKSSQ
jgi:hypothetical protein